MPDGRIVAGGQTYDLDTDTTQAAAVRLNADGSFGAGDDGIAFSGETLPGHRDRFGRAIRIERHGQRRVRQQRLQPRRLDRLFQPRLGQLHRVRAAERRGAGGPVADMVDTIKIWFTASSFTPTLGSGNPANNPTPQDPPDEINITDRTTSTLREYIFPDLRTVTGSHVTMQFIGDPGRNPGTNPGGYEYREHFVQSRVGIRIRL